MVCWVRNLGGDLGSLTFARCPGVGNLALLPDECQNPLGLPPPPWGLTLIDAFPTAKSPKALNIVVYISTGLRSSLSGAELVVMCSKDLIFKKILLYLYNFLFASHSK